jgi:hypothetical protein
MLTDQLHQQPLNDSTQEEGFSLVVSNRQDQQQQVQQTNSELSIISELPPPLSASTLSSSTASPIDDVNQHDTDVLNTAVTDEDAGRSHDVLQRESGAALSVHRGTATVATTRSLLPSGNPLSTNSAHININSVDFGRTEGRRQSNLPPPTGTTTVFVTSSSSTNAFVDENADESTTSQHESFSSPQNAEVSHPAATTTTTTTTTITSNSSSFSSNYNAITLAVAERVASTSSSASFADFDGDLEGQMEDRVRERAYQIARNVLDEIRQNAVHADQVIQMTPGAADASITLAAEPQDQQSLSEEETPPNKEVLSNSVQRRRIHILLGLVAVLGFAVIALVIVLATKSNGNTALVSSIQTATSAPIPARCSFCASGAQSSYNLAQLRKIPIGSNPSYPTCADLFLYQQNLSSTDSSCPLLQALSFYYYCGCLTLPPRPKNASCTACPNGAIAGGSLFCAKVDTVVTIVGSSLFYFENCAQLASTELRKYGCACPYNATTRHRQ